MAIYLDELNNLQLYKRTFILPINLKNKLKGSCVLLVTPNYEESKSIMTNPKKLDLNLFKSYYMERNIFYIIGNNKIIKENTTYIDEHALKAKERTDFGLPSKRKYPMPDKEHVLLAIKFFNHVDSADEKELARNINSKIKSYGLTGIHIGDNNRFKKYYNESMLLESSVGTYKDTKEVYDSLSDIDKKFVSPYPLKYSKYVVFRYIKKIDNKNVGFVEASAANDDKDVYLIMGVNPNYQHKGIGKELLKRTIDECKKLGYKKIVYTLNIDNIASDKLVSSFKDAKLKSKTKEFKTYEIPLNESTILESSGTYNDSKEIYDSLYSDEKLYVSPRGNFINSPYLAFRYVKKINNVNAGFIEAYDFKSKEGTVYVVLAVKEKYRHRGIAKELLSKAVKECKKLGFKTLIYELNAENVASKKFISSFKSARLYSSDKYDISYEIPLNEANIELLSTVDDEYVNFEKFKNREVNVCFILGLSGSGKSTLANEIAKKYNAKVIGLDNLHDGRMAFRDNIIKEFAKFRYNSETEYDEKVTILRRGKNGDELFAKVIKDCIEYFISRSNRNNRFVIEGVQIGLVPLETVKDQAIIFKGTSMVKSFSRRYIRDVKRMRPDYIIHDIVHLKDMYNDYSAWARDINRFKDEYIKENEEDIFAPYMPINEEYVLTDDYLRTKDSFIVLSEKNAMNYNMALKRFLYNERFKTSKDLILHYKKVKEEIPSIRRTYLDLKMYKASNIYIDWSHYSESFFKNNIYKLDRGLDLYFDFLNRFIFNPKLLENGYTKQTVIVSLDGWKLKEGTNLWDYTKNINPVSVIYRYIRRFPTKLEKWKSANFIFMSKYAYFKVDFNNFELKNISKFIRNIDIIQRREHIEDNSVSTPNAIAAEIVDKIERGTQIKIYNLTGNTSSLSKSDLADKIKSTKISSAKDKKEKIKYNSRVEKEVSIKNQEKENKKIINKQKDELVAIIKDNAAKNKTESDTFNAINNNNEVKNLLVSLNQNEPSGVKLSVARVSRLNKLNDSFMKKKIHNTTVKELIDQSRRTSEPIPKTDLKIKSIDDEWKNLKYLNFGKSYNIDADIASIMEFLSRRTYPISIVDFTKEDISTSEDSIYLYKYKLEDYSGKRYTLAFEIPKFKNDRFMRLRGNNKTINGQLTLLPIIKTDTDTAQIVSNYNKIFIRRYNTSTGKSFEAANILLKTLDKLKDNKNTKIKITYADNTRICDKYELPIDYIDIASSISKISIDNYIIYFNQDEIRENYDIDLSKGTPYAYNTKDKKILYLLGNIPASKQISHFLFVDEEFRKIYNTTKGSRKYTYSKASILNTEIPVIVIMGYSEGLQKSLKKADVSYKIVDKANKENYDPIWQDKIKFKDGFLIYDNTYNSSLLLNGLKECDTENYSITEIDSKNMWLDFLDNYGGRIKADGLDNFYDLMMDPITAEICKKYDIPSDYIEALAYANFLLSDNKYNRHVDINGNRFRTNELIAGYIYKALANAYGDYKNQIKRNKKDAKLTMKQSAVIDAIMIDPTFADLSILSPVLELESANSVSFKGLSGMNSDRSYGLDKRTFDDSMINKLAMSTGFAGNVGITRQATIDMDLQDNRGAIKNIESLDEMSDTKTLCITEALTPFGATRDDPFRSAMTFIQTAKHGMRTKHSDPLLVTNGADLALPYLTSDMFAYKAKFDGVVEKITKDYMVIKSNKKISLNDGSSSNSIKIQKDVIDLRDRVKKNSDGGFYVSIKLDTNLRVGSKFKKGDILAYDKSSYSNEVGDGHDIAYALGTLNKLAIMNTDEGYEDSAIISSKLSEDMTSYIIVLKDVSLPKNTHVHSMVKVGQPIQEGDPLIIFQNAFDDETANSLLKSLSGDEDEINELGRISLKSKVTGTIKDIKIYRTVEKNELSPSLKKIVNQYEKSVEDYNSVLSKNGLDTKEADSTYKLDATGKLKNSEDSVLIEFYIEYEDKFSVGDKLVYYSALKGVVKDVFPEGKEPTSEFRPTEKLDTILAIESVENRMVASVVIVGSINKILIELDRKVKKILGIECRDLHGEIIK